MLRAADAAKALKGKIAIANAKVAYGHFANLLAAINLPHCAAPGRTTTTAACGPAPARKTQTIPMLLYVEELIGPETVNTLPPKTMDAFRDHGVAAARLPQGLADAHQTTI